MITTRYLAIAFVFIFVFALFVYPIIDPEHPLFGDSDMGIISGCIWNTESYETISDVVGYPFEWIADKWKVLQTTFDGFADAQDFWEDFWGETANAFKEFFSSFVKE